MGWTEYHARIYLNFILIGVWVILIDHMIFHIYYHHSSQLAFSPREMIKHSKQWAQARGLCETSEIHGKEEWRIPTTRSFEHIKSSGSETSQMATFLAEDLLVLVVQKSNMSTFHVCHFQQLLFVGYFWKFDGE